MKDGRLLVCLVLLLLLRMLHLLMLLLLLLLLRETQQRLGEAATALLLKVRHLLLVVLLLQVATVVRQMPCIIAARSNGIVFRGCITARQEAQAGVRFLRVRREYLVLLVGGERGRWRWRVGGGWCGRVRRRSIAMQLVPMVVGVAGRLAQVRLHLIVIIMTNAGSDVAIVARIAVAAAVIAGRGALEQCGSALIQCRLSAFLQQIAAAQLRQVVIVAALLLLLLLLQVLQQSQAAHAAIALHRWGWWHRRYHIHIRQAGRVALGRERRM